MTKSLRWILVTCPLCNGRGKRGDHTCTLCKGKKMIRVPPEEEDGT